MVISIRKAILLFFILFFAFVTIFVTVKKEIVKTSATLPLSGKKIVIDAGHGGIDGGATSKSGITEKDINLKIAFYLKNYLEKSGAKVIMTRLNDKSLETDDNGSIKSRKRSDLLARRNIANNSGADVLVSIHLNYFEQSKYKGAQVFYEGVHKESAELAQIIQNELKSGLDKNNNRQITKIQDSKIMYQNLNLPAVITECGFLSNPDEAQKLTQKEYQEKIALCINLGIIKYFSQNKNA
jgi:N-acetylmuramoyl-L-alanine amidase